MIEAMGGVVIAVAAWVEPGYTPSIAGNLTRKIGTGAE